MEPILVHPCYFGPISEFVALVKADRVIFENEDNFQKQTYRNRMYIYGANGKLLLNIPVKHTGNKSQHQKYRDVKIENDFPWQKQHWKSLQTVYRTSPFFEFYEEEFHPLYHENFRYLLDFNYRCLELVLDCLQLKVNFARTDMFSMHPKHVKDLRSLVDAKGVQKDSFEHYYQVFQEKYGFLNNLCIVDLLFNEGPNALHYLENQELKGI